MSIIYGIVPYTRWYRDKTYAFYIAQGIRQGMQYQDLGSHLRDKKDAEIMLNLTKLGNIPPLAKMIAMQLKATIV